jgi:hypothetical protein
MHRSRLCAFVIDCKTDNLDAATSFWSQALGKPIRALKPEEAAGTYRELTVKPQEPMLLMQKVEHPSRIHLDIETDNLDAEVARLEALGARRVEFIKRWWVMESPTGQRFCVVNPQRGPLDDTANTWP